MAKAKTRRVRRSPLERDRHWLYQQAVQCPEADVKFFDRVYKHKNGKLPSRLHEDFCGTAALAAEWVRTRPGNRALGIDLDRPTLEWGRKHNVAPLGDAASRVDLVHGNVLAARQDKADVVAAMNFSYFIFKQREQLREYFATVRQALARGGVFILDIFGGWEAQALEEEEKGLEGFDYFWDQEAYDPVTHETLFHIHFHLDEGVWMRKAFTYDWRLWTVPEVREVLAEAGFHSSDVYWENTDRKTGEGNGVFRRVQRAETCPGWIAYIVAH